MLTRLAALAASWWGLVLTAEGGHAVVASVAATGVAARGTAVNPAVARVAQMLENLVSLIETEATQDTEKHQHYSDWANNEMSTTGEKIGTLTTEIENTNALLGELRTRKAQLSAIFKSVSAELSKETSQAKAATDKRNEERAAFDKESTDFKNAIAACKKAVQLLGAHYDKPAAQGKPEWMSLLDVIRGQAHTLLKRATSARRARAFVERQPNFEAYEDSTGDAMSIVDEIKSLKESFEEDYQSSIQEENKLKADFTELITKKNEIIKTLTDQKTDTETKLNSVKEEIASSEGKLAMDENSLKNEQKYLSDLTTQLKTAKEAFAEREKDRNAESAAVKEALGVLQEFLPSFVQRSEGVARLSKEVRHGSVTQAGGRKRLAQRVTQGLVKRQGLALKATMQRTTQCVTCSKAGAFLSQRAKMLHSSRLIAAAAATTSMGSEAIDDVIDKLEDMIDRIDEAYKVEKEHKEWCEDETGLTTKKRDTHEYAIADIKQVIAGLLEEIDMDKKDLRAKSQEIDEEEASFDMQTRNREDGKEEYEEDLQDHIDAIKALNEAIEILANFYKKRNQATLLQRSNRFSSSQQAPEGGQALDIMVTARKQFEGAKDHLNKEETEAVADFEVVKKEHQKLEADLSHDKDVITVETQTDEQNEDSAEADLENHVSDKKAADDYLNQLGRSCYPLLARFEERKKLRKEEKDAIKDAIKVLKTA